jgi:hypothetical protein
LSFNSSSVSESFLKFLGDSSELLLDSFLDFLLNKGSQLLLGGAIGLVGLANPSLVGEALLLLGRVALLVGKSAAFFSVVAEVGPMFLAEMGWLLLAVGLVVVLVVVVGGRTLLLCNGIRLTRVLFGSLDVFHEVDDFRNLLVQRIESLAIHFDLLGLRSPVKENIQDFVVG